MNWTCINCLITILKVSNKKYLEKIGEIYLNYVFEIGNNHSYYTWYENLTGSKNLWKCIAKVKSVLDWILEVPKNI